MYYSFGGRKPNNCCVKQISLLVVKYIADLNLKEIMKSIIKICLVLAIISGALYMFIHKRAKPAGLRIALLTPITHPALCEVERGFKETMSKALSSEHATTSIHYSVFNANGNKTLLRAQADEIVVGGYDLIFTMAASPSQIVAELLAKKELETPHIFGAIDGYDIVNILQTVRPASTGAYLAIDYTKQMDELFTLKPDIKNILLVYDPAHGVGLEKEKNLIANYVTKYGARLQAIEVYSAHEIQQKVATSLPQADVVLVLIDNTVVSGIDALITLCNKHNVILMASDIPSGQKGATIAYGITEYESGAQAAHKAAQVLIEGKNPRDIAATAITKFNLLINKDAPQARLLHIAQTKEMQHV